MPDVRSAMVSRRQAACLSAQIPDLDVEETGVFALRRHFEVDPESIAVAALREMASTAEVEPGLPTEAARRYRLDEPDFHPFGISAEGDT